MRGVLHSRSLQLQTPTSVLEHNKQSEEVGSSLQLQTFPSVALLQRKIANDPRPPREDA